MAILSKGQTFANADSVTSTKLNNLVDAATFVSGSSGTTDDSSLEVNVGGRLQIKDLGVNSAKLAAGAVTTTKLPDSTLATDGVTYAKVQRVANMKALGNVSGSLGIVTEVPILDEDNMASDSATALATQQSIKAYTDTKVAAVITRGTAVATTSGTSVDFTSLPTGIKRITVMFNGVSTNGTSVVQVQLGNGSFVTSGYFSVASGFASSVVSTNHTSGIATGDSSTAAMNRYGNVYLTTLGSNIWTATGLLASPAIGQHLFSGGLSLAGALDRVRITTVNGTDTFDAGSINIMYE
jgi:hypothetical protein